ncbi:hypothetical protein BASA62_006490 [Batrachochytrium salamandrivorans]|nr:hypothetical protein BASA62_006490 [Batrachochytrium salamandrivorans]
MERHTRIQGVLALLVIQTNPDIPDYLNTPQRNKPRIAYTIQDPQPQYYRKIRMKLAIASTTFLFAMMAAQAAVLSVAPATGVNLVKRTPNGDGDVEQSDMTGQSSSVPTSQDSLTKEEEDLMKHVYGSLCKELSRLAKRAESIPEEIFKLKAFITKLKGCNWEASPACTIANTEIAKFEGRLASLEVQLEATLEEYETKLHERNDVEKARRLEDHAYLRSYLEDHLVEVG